MLFLLRLRFPASLLRVYPSSSTTPRTRCLVPSATKLSPCKTRVTVRNDTPDRSAINFLLTVICSISLIHPREKEFSYHCPQGHYKSNVPSCQYFFKNFHIFFYFLTYPALSFASDSNKQGLSPGAEKIGLPLPCRGRKTQLSPLFAEYCRRHGKPYQNAHRCSGGRFELISSLSGFLSNRNRYSRSNSGGTGDAPRRARPSGGTRSAF